MRQSLNGIARALGGRVRGNRVVASGPGQKPRDRSLTVWIDGDEFRVHSHRDADWRVVKDYVRDRAGIPWQPRRRAPEPKQPVPFAVRNQFLGETLSIVRYRRRITFEQFALLINDLRLRGEPADDARRYAREFGFTSADLERTMQAKPRHYTADERAKIFQISYAERQHLGLRRTGSCDVDKAGRERARSDRYNAKRRAARARAKAAGVNRRGPSSTQVVRGITHRRLDTALRYQNLVHLYPRSVVTTPQLKSWCRVDGDDEDDLIIAHAGGAGSKLQPTSVSGPAGPSRRDFFLPLRKCGFWFFMCAHGIPPYGQERCCAG